ncbi:helix-turn-helix domain-containing protein [Streptomyces sp. NBC_00237]|uniref:helix-turn-helix domain-containing protein n=1 Tax=Streptomyces sp. NBC_00237 TaxID=2975687 RepID=UPI00225079EF|nr:helix-turn-helix domain-containing protein [Streptomyces sp. NBC_00237]MCX5201092.1 helix-turn-helix domain-containing protein [Streptomyces sp. NBC_00237]
MTRHTYPEAAAILRIEESWLRRHIKQLPHTKLGRTVRFTDADLDRIDELFHHEPTSGPLARAVAAPASTAPHPLAQLRPLPPRGAPVRIA